MNLIKNIKELSQVLIKKIQIAHKSSKYQKIIKKNEKLSYKLHYQIGLRYYNEHREDATGEYKEYCDGISRLEKEMLNLEQQVEEMNDITTCPSCKHKNDGSVFFCQNCGFFLEENKKKEDMKELEVIENEATENEATENEASENEATEIEVTENEATENEATEIEVTENETEEIKNEEAVIDDIAEEKEADMLKPIELHVV
ncbi:MAG: hypothetical protein R3Y58_06530 [Eubacteriales bacterium]